MENWIETYTGRRFCFDQFDAAEFNIRDIAHALSMQCRFNGHCPMFYSVAQHSVLVSGALPPEHSLWGLMHDAAEAYLGDMVAPLKQGFVEYRFMEDELLEKIAGWAGLPWPVPTIVWGMDQKVLRTEHRDIMGQRQPWGIDEQWLPLSEVIRPVGPFEAERMFLDRWNELRHRGELLRRMEVNGESLSRMLDNERTES